MELETERLYLRQWKSKDFEDFYNLNSDPEVMKFFPKLLSRKESDELANTAKLLIEKNGWGLWACELKANSSFLGFTGLNEPGYKLPFGSCVEVGWRFSKEHWGRGYATEAGLASLEYAFCQLGFEEIVSFAVTTNSQSISVMKRLGMSNTHSNFSHPKVPKDSALSEHALYKIDKATWRANNT